MVKTPRFEASCLQMEVETLVIKKVSNLYDRITTNMSLTYEHLLKFVYISENGNFVIFM